MNLAEEFHIISQPATIACRRPFTNTINRQNRSLFKSGKIEGARSVSLVMTNYFNRTFVTEYFANLELRLFSLAPDSYTKFFRQIRKQHPDLSLQFPLRVLIIGDTINVGNR